MNNATKDKIIKRLEQSKDNLRNIKAFLNGHGETNAATRRLTQAEFNILQAIHVIKLIGYKEETPETPDDAKILLDTESNPT